MIEYDVEIPFCLEDSACFSHNIFLILNFIQSALLLWKNVKEANVHMTRLGAAMTNTVFIVSHDVDEELPRKILLRVYGEGVDYILDRQQELAWFSKLSDLRIGPKLLAAFKNGRLEEYIESETLTPSTIRDPLISSSIAASLARFHATIRRDNAADQEPILWNRLESWRQKAVSAFEYLSSQGSSESLKRIDELGVMNEEFALGTLVNWRINVCRFESPIVFSHNDLQHGNILLTQSGSIVMIDYEYGGINYALYDIANHFCEWASDFTAANPRPEIMDFDGKYPSENERRRFIEAYLDVFNSSPPTTELVDSWLEAIEHFRNLSDVIWGYWGVIQASKSDIDFNYLAYSVCRFEDALRPSSHVIANLK